MHKKLHSLLRPNDRSLKAGVSENGNVFFLVMIGIALFAALSFTVSRSSNTKSTNLLTDKQADLAASEAMDYAQTVARGVGRLIANNCSESQISFEPPPFDGSTAYNNTNAPGNQSCHVFSSAGGKVRYRTLPEQWRGTGSGRITPVITASTCIPGVGTGDDGTCLGNSDAFESEILFIIPNLATSICTRMQEALGTYGGTVTIAPDLTAFNGTFSDISTGITAADLANNYTGVDSACWKNSTNNYYYKVLLAR